MPIYRAYNLNLQSQIVLNGLEEITAIPDISVRVGDLSQMDPNELDCGDRVLGKLEDKGRFLIQHSHEIIIDPVMGLDQSSLSSAVLGPAMAILLRQRGMLTLHASCVAINGKAIAFLGGSGWGKSTLAKAFHHQGYRVLTDDVMAIQFDDGPSVIPSFPLFKLSPEAADFFGIDSTKLSPLFPGAPKLAYGFTGDFSHHPLPLSRIYVLARGACHEILPLSSQAAFAELVRHTRGISLLTAPDCVTAHLHQCTRLLETIPMYKFFRKPSLDDILKSVMLIEDHLGHGDLEAAIGQQLSPSESSAATAR